MTKLKNSNCDKNQLKFVTKINASFGKTQKLKLLENLTVEITKYFSKNNLNTLTTDEMFKGQCFAILAMFCYNVEHFNWVRRDML